MPLLLALALLALNDPLPPLNKQGVPSSLSLILRTALSKDPSLRYSSALEFARALQNVQTELHLSVTPIDILEASAGGDETDQPPDTGTELVNPISISADSSCRHVGLDLRP